jgi:hypothetical protein
MKSTTSWTWAPRAELDPATERNAVWINPHLPSNQEQARQPLRLEVSVLESFQQAYDQLERFFSRDSVLAAVVRRHDTCRFLIYSAISDVAAYDRCRDVRNALRITTFGYSIATEPTWASLAAFDDDTLPATGTPWLDGETAGPSDDR